MKRIRRHKRLWVSARLIALIVCLAMLSSFSAAQTDVPRYITAPCPFAIYGDEIEGETVSCGWLEVPENRATPHTKHIQLAIAIVYSTNPNAAPDPIIYLEGGPGGSGVSTIDYWYQSALRAHRNIILIDQRGTGYSRPSLNCPEIDDPDQLNPMRACVERLRQEEVDLAAYTSAESAADIADLIRALGLEEANLYGVSYGSRLALTILRDFPENIRSVILDGVYPPHIDFYHEQPLNGYRAFAALFDACQADAECAIAYPNLRQVFIHTVMKLNNDPAQVPDWGEFSGDDFVRELFDQLYDSAAIPYLPARLYAVSQGDYMADPYGDAQWRQTLMDYLNISEEQAFDAYIERLSADELAEIEFAAFHPFSYADYDAILMDYLGITDFDTYNAYINSLSDESYYELEAAAFGWVDSDSEGLFNSIQCYDEVPFNSLLEVRQRSQVIPLELREALLEGISAQFSECLMWQMPTPPPWENAPVFSAIPALLLSGQFDPITPPAWGESAVQYLPNGRHYVFPGLGHSIVDIHPCPTQIAIHFLENPFDALDTSCITAMKLNFYIP